MDPDSVEIVLGEIQDLVGRTFRGHDISHLVAGILDAHGYCTTISEQGPDGGVDLMAVRQDPAFGEVRVVGQTRSGSGRASAPDVRELVGAMTMAAAQGALFVSLGGFTRPAEREVDRTSAPIKLWDARELARQMVLVYPALNLDLQARVPLRITSRISMPLNDSPVERVSVPRTEVDA